jgi:hypothetical protein
MYRYFPHTEERVNTIHNVQHVDIVEHMGSKHAKDLCILGQQAR